MEDKGTCTPLMSDEYEYNAADNFLFKMGARTSQPLHQNDAHSLIY
jgi:hypothetical protein